MTIDNKDGAAFLAYVTDKLETRIAHISQSILEGQKDIEGMHEYYWENYTEMDQYGYENFDNQQALLHQINANEQQIHLRKRFRKMLDSPFFGRVDFVFEGDEECGSRGLEEFLAEHRTELAADLVFFSDGPKDPSGLPIIALGAKGDLSIHITVETMNRNVHARYAPVLP